MGEKAIIRGRRNGLGELTRRIQFYTRKLVLHSDKSKPRRARRYERLLAYKQGLNKLIKEDFRKGGYGI